MTSSQAQKLQKNKDQQKERDAFQERERMKNYENRQLHFANGERELQSQYRGKESYTKLNFIHYAIILSILISIIVFSLFLLLTYIPATKPHVMKFIETQLSQ